MINQTPWFERTFNFDFPVGLFPIIIERLRGTAPRLQAQLKDIPESKLVMNQEGRWSVKEELGHLGDLEGLWAGRVEDFLAGLPVLRPADLTNRRTHEANHNNLDISDLLSRFQSARTALIERVKNLDAMDAERVSTHPRLQSTMRLVDSLFFVAEHDDHHLTRIRFNLGGYTWKPSGTGGAQQ